MCVRFVLEEGVGGGGTVHINTCQRTHRRAGWARSPVRARAPTARHARRRDVPGPPQVPATPRGVGPPQIPISQETGSCSAAMATTKYSLVRVPSAGAAAAPVLCARMSVVATVLNMKKDIAAPVTSSICARPRRSAAPRGPFGTGPGRLQRACGGVAGSRLEGY